MIRNLLPKIEKINQNRIGLRVKIPNTEKNKTKQGQILIEKIKHLNKILAFLQKFTQICHQMGGKYQMLAKNQRRRNSNRTKIEYLKKCSKRMEYGKILKTKKQKIWKTSKKLIGQDRKLYILKLGNMDFKRKNTIRRILSSLFFLLLRSKNMPRASPEGTLSTFMAGNSHKTRGYPHPVL